MGPALPSSAKGVEDEYELTRWRSDGPALRALALIPYANLLLDRNLPLDMPYVVDHLYAPQHVKYPGLVVKNDLEEVAHGWWKGGFDLWEEV